MSKFNPKITPGPWNCEDTRNVMMKRKQIASIPSNFLRQGKVDIQNAMAIVAVPELLEVYKTARELKGDTAKWVINKDGSVTFREGTPFLECVLKMGRAIENLEKMHGSDV